MSWLFSQALVEAFSEDISSDGELSVPSSGTPTQQAYSSHDRTTEFSRRSLSGMTCKPLTEDRGEALLTSYLAAFPVKTSARQEREQGSTENDPACGHTWRESSVKYDPASSSWKTHRCLWEEDLPESSVTLPPSGTMRRGVCWERLTSARPTNETGSGLWLPTPTASSYGQNKNPGENAKERPSLATMARKNLWPTPTATANMLSPSMQKWPAHRNLWPTPTAHNAKEGAYPSEHNRNTPTLAVQAGGSLNPTWVEWLMGWPLGWTDLGPLEMDRFRKWQESHGKYCEKKSVDKMEAASAARSD